MYLWLRFAKLLAVALLFAGSLGAVLPADLRDRRRFAFGVAGPGFILSWFFGFMLLAEISASFLEPWILGAMGLSFVSLNGVLWAVGREGRRSWGSAAFILVTLVGALALMVFRPR
jgi:hypothetical protein